MAEIRMPITIALLQNGYTATVLAGPQNQPVNVILDTGSSVFAMDGQIYGPDFDPTVQTTMIAQTVQYGSAAWVGAVVQTQIALAPSAQLQNVAVAITYAVQPMIFGGAQGILGLAYQLLDSGHLMQADSWAGQYDADQIATRPATDVLPFFDQLVQADVEPARFGFLVRRAMMRGAPATAQADPANAGIFVLGGGPDYAGLRSGDFTDIAVMHEKYYNVNLLSIQVDGKPAIAVKPPAPGSNVASNAIVDSGCSAFQLDQDLYAALLRAFAAAGTGFDTMLTNYGIKAGRFADQTTIDPRAWPDLRLTIQGADGTPQQLAVTASEYWQFDATAAGQAVAMLAGDGGKLGGQSILGLPLFTRYFVLFDRGASNGHGIVRFATQA
jgi:hypothetical protein